MTTIDKKRFKNAIRSYREQNDLTQKELARKLFTTTTTIARWELGLSTPKSERTIRELRSMGMKV